MTETVPVTEERRTRRLDRRQALRRIGAAGAVAWTVPAVQTINMSKAFAQAARGSPLPGECGNARVSLGGACELPNFNPNAGCGGQSCLATANQDAPSACGSIVSAVAADDADWVICISEGCRFQEISMAAAGACWNSPGAPDCGGDETFDWSGVTVSGSCATIHRPTALNPQEHEVTHDISHVDLVICCQPSD